jgi:hypothetical protein
MTQYAATEMGPVLGQHDFTKRGDEHRLTAGLVEDELNKVIIFDGATQNRLTEISERSQMLAEQFIAQCGYDLEDSDQRGERMGDSVCQALRFAFLRIGTDDVMDGML